MDGPRVKVEINESDLDDVFAGVQNAHPRIVGACRETAERVAAEARARVARRTGHTADTIRVEKAHSGDGHVVIADGAGHWLEYGTKFMAARPFLHNSARLEMGSHERRVMLALTDALADA